MASSGVMASRSLPNRSMDQMNVDEILRSIYSDSSDAFSSSSKEVAVAWREPGMTLEDFLAKAGAVDEQQQYGGTAMDQPAVMSPATGVPAALQFGFGVELGSGGMVVGGGIGRGKRKVEEAPLDKAAQQKQRRMIKNRESAARSRERKQAYTFELESLVTQLEEDNGRLVKEQAELNRERYKQLMKNLIPVIEKRRPRRLSRARSMEW